MQPLKALMTPLQRLRSQELGNDVMRRLGFTGARGLSLYELLYYPLVFVWIFFSVVNESRLSDSVPCYRVRVLATAFIALGYALLVWKPSIKSLLAEACIALVALCAYRSGLSVIAMSVVIAWCGRAVDLRKALRTSFFALVISIAVVVGLAALGLIADISIYRYGSGVGEVDLRHCLGFGYTTFLSHYWLTLVLLIIYLQEWKPSIPSVVALLLGNVAIYLLTDSRSSFLLVFVVLAGFLAYPTAKTVAPHWLKVVVRYFLKNSYIIFAVLSLVLLFAFPWEGRIGSLINTLLTKRVMYTQQARASYGFSLFGQNISWSTTGYVAGKGVVTGYMANGAFVEAPYCYVDNSFVNLAMTMGIIPTLLVLVGMELMSRKLVNDRKYRLALVMTVYGVHSVLDPQMLYLHYCPFLVLAGGFLDGEGIVMTSNVSDKNTSASRGMRVAIVVGISAIVAATIPFFFRGIGNGNEHGVVADYYTLESSTAEQEKEQYNGSTVVGLLGESDARRSMLELGGAYTNRLVKWHALLSPSVSGSYQFSVLRGNNVRVILDNEVIIDSQDSKNSSMTNKSEYLMSDKRFSLIQGEYYDLEMEWSFVPAQEAKDNVYSSELFWQSTIDIEPLPVPYECLCVPRDAQVPRIAMRDTEFRIDTSQAMLDLAMGEASGSIAATGAHLDRVSHVMIVPKAPFSAHELLEAQILSQRADEIVFAVPAELSAGSWRIEFLDEDGKEWLTYAEFFVILAERASMRTEQPRPDLARADYQSLNGTWEFAPDDELEGIKNQWYQATAQGEQGMAQEDPFRMRIQVPYSWTSDLSGFGDPDDVDVAWYRRTFEVDPAWDGSRIFLRFGAVDEEATVWINGTEVFTHLGGYTPFEMDITDYVQPGNNLLVVRVNDEVRFGTGSSTGLVGKQGFEPDGGHTTNAGIWQSVWLERRDNVWLKGYSTSLDVRQSAASMSFEIAGDAGKVSVEWDLRPARYNAQSNTMEKTDGIALVGAADCTVCPLGVGGSLSVDLNASELDLWTADNPTLYMGTITIKRDGTAIDTAEVAVGFREVASTDMDGLGGSVITINGLPTFLEGTVVQGYWQEGVYSAPTAESLKDDLLAAKQLGFNAVRVLEKIEDPQFYSWCDRLGLYVLQDIPDATLLDVLKAGVPARGRVAVEQTIRECALRDVDHPSVIVVAVPGIDTEDDRRENMAQDKMNRVMWQKQLYDLVHEVWPGILVTDSPAGEIGHAGSSDVNLVERVPLVWNEATSDVKQWSASTYAGSSWNMIGSNMQDGEPLVVGGHDYMVADQTNALTTWLWQKSLLRAEQGVAGGYWANLYDVEYDHSGLLAYDRSPKTLVVDHEEEQLPRSENQHTHMASLVCPGIITMLPGSGTSLKAVVSNWSDSKYGGTLHWRSDELGISGELAVEVDSWSKDSFDITIEVPLHECRGVLEVWLDDDATGVSDVKIINVDTPGGLGSVLDAALDSVNGN